MAGGQTEREDKVSLETTEEILQSMEVGMTFRDYSGRISSMDFHKTSNFLVTASDDESIRLYDVANATLCDNCKMEREEGVVVRGRVEIDMRQPFRSVKEAVMLFGEKVLAGEIHAKHLQESKAGTGVQNQHKFGAARVELEETKQSLQKAKEEGDFMAHCLQSLREELEQTRREIQQLKSTREVVVPQQKVPLVDSDDDDIHEELKFIEQPSSKVEVKTQTGEEEEEEEIEFEKKRSVKFASPPLLTKVIAVNKLEDYVSKETGEKSPSHLKKKLKRKPLIPLIGALFSKKK